MTSDLKSTILALTTAWAAIPIAHGASAEVDKFPTRPIRLIAPFVPGGGTDITARAIGAHIRSEIAKWRKLVKDAALVLH